MSFRPIYEGWDLTGKVSRSIRRTFAGLGLNRDIAGARTLTEDVRRKLSLHRLDTPSGQREFADSVVDTALQHHDQADPRLKDHLASILFDVALYEGWFALPKSTMIIDLSRSELWELEDQLKRVEAIV
ncbi:MAG: hypothetical protein AAGB04_30615, partial [Pseudomonadota bacterium]